MSFHLTTQKHHKDDRKKNNQRKYCIETIERVIVQNIAEFKK